MSKMYKVWIHVEEIDEEKDEYIDLELDDNMPIPVTYVETKETALQFAEWLGTIGQGVCPYEVTQKIIESDKPI